jgi:hypothetical protein
MWDRWGHWPGRALEADAVRFNSGVVQRKATMRNAGREPWKLTPVRPTKEGAMGP